MIQEEIQSTMEPTSVMALDGLNSRRKGTKLLRAFPPEIAIPEASVHWHLGKYDEKPNYGNGGN